MYMYIYTIQILSGLENVISNPNGLEKQATASINKPSSSFNDST